MTVCVAALFVVLASAVEASAQPAPLPPPFVHLRAVDPTIRQDIRYFTAFNFTGRRVPGYDAPECILLRPAAEALKRAQARLAGEGFHLKVYDCYRPERAVRFFIDWAQDGKPDPMEPMFSPGMPKAKQFALGYLAKRSRHSLGTAVDAGLVRATDPDLPTPTRAGLCDGPFAQRARESSLDFGTAYDCASPLSATASLRVSQEAQANRARLVQGMAAEGFRNYAKEWWHFDFMGVAGPTRPQDFAVRCLAPVPGCGG